MNAYKMQNVECLADLRSATSLQERNQQLCTQQRLDTIEEDEDLVVATQTLSTWQGPNASASKSMLSAQQASKRSRRRRKAKV
jgi:hypothetical protein